jgi:dUTP pyrophosphatase
MALRCIAAKQGKLGGAGRGFCGVGFSCSITLIHVIIPVLTTSCAPERGGLLPRGFRMTEPINIAVARLENGQGLALPEYQTAHAAGMDLLAAVGEPVVLKPMERYAVPCGFAMALPPGFEAQIRPRSGLALKMGLGMPNAPGTIDADYRGEVKVLVINLGSEAVTITRGMRIAQMVICPVVRGSWLEVTRVDQLPATQRGTGGFGSTGT